MIDQRQLRATVLCGLLGVTAFAMQAAETERKSAGVRASVLIGNPIEDSRGWRQGILDDLLVDPADGRVAFAVVDAGSRFETPVRSLALALPDAKVSVVEGSLRVDMTLRELKRLPSLEGELESLDSAGKARLVSLKALMNASLLAAAGRDLGDVEEAVVDIERARLAYVIVDYDPSWQATGRRVALEEPEVRSTNGGGGDVVVVADDSRLRSAPEWNAAVAGLPKESLWHKMQRWLGLL